MKKIYITSVILHTHRFLLAIAVIAIFTLLFTKPTFAASLSLGTAPTSEKLQLSPGQKYNGELVIWNLSEKAITYQIVIRGFRQIENQPGTAVILTENQESKSLYTATSWLTTNIQNIELVPNKNEKIYYEINVPKDATKGEYSVMISFISENEAKLSGTGAVTTLSSGMPILIKIGTEFVENAELLDFSTDKNFYEYPKITFNTRVKNLGDTHITPVGEIVLTNMFHQEITRLPFNPNNQSILRDNTGDYETNWNLGTFLTKDKILVLGPITANLILTYRTFQPGFAPLTSQISFWVLPWRLILLAVIVIVATIIIVRVSKRRKSRINHPLPR